SPPTGSGASGRSATRRNSVPGRTERPKDVVPGRDNPDPAGIEEDRMKRAATVGSLRVPDARLHFEVRGQGPLLVLVGAPMDAQPFEPLADLLATDHTVLTTDPRGINRSSVDDPDQDSTPPMRADDLARLVAHLGAGPAAVFGSSGGAVSALALVETRPDLVHTVIAHEPPLADVLDD